MNNPNHPLYSALSGGSNIHLLDNMLFSSDQHKPILNSQYVYSNMEQLAAHHQHAMNLAVSEQAAAVAAANNAASTIDSSALLYHQQNDHHQQQPISYKIPQVSSVLLSQHQHHQHQQQQQQQQHHQHHTLASAMASVSSLQDRKKDIIAEALREERIFEEINRSVDKKPVITSIPTTTAASSESSRPTPVAIKSEPNTSTTPKLPEAGPSNPKPGTSGMAGGSGTPHNPMVSTRGRGAGRPPMRQQQQQIMPRLQLLEEEDDGLTCRMCLQPFWYKNELHDHLKSTHSISDPDRYEREEREKKLRRIREEQQRMAIAKQQRMGGRGRGVSIMSRGVGTIRGAMRGRGGGIPPPGRLGPAGPRPSFQYRDGSFICDLCKKSFSDGNDMVAHWKSHVKQQQGDKRYADRGPGRPAKTHMTSHGRPITKKQAGRRSRKAARKDKGRPRWTAYLIWSTRRRKEIALEHEGWTFAQVGKQISEEWKEITPTEVEKLKEEAEELNAKGARKLPKVMSSGEEESWSEADDPSFDETSVKKPIIMKIKREEVQRSGRNRKRPSFFQDFENEENNLDKILDEFEQQQMEEAANPKPKVEKKTPRTPRPRRKRELIQDDDEIEYPIELETTRSGRVRKKTKFFHFMDDEGDEDSSKDEEEDVYQPDSEPEEPDEEFMEESEEEQPSEDKEEGGEGDGTGVKQRRRSITLPPKKRRRRRSSKNSGMTEDEIKEATRAALAAKPVVISLKKKSEKKPSWMLEEDESNTTDSDDDDIEGLEEGEVEQDDEDDEDDEPVVGTAKVKTEPKSGSQVDAEERERENPLDDVTKNIFAEKVTKREREDDDENKNEGEDDNALEGSVTEEDPPENMFGDDEEEEGGQDSAKNKDEGGKRTEVGNKKSNIADEGEEDALEGEVTEETTEQDEHPVEEMDHAEEGANNDEEEESNPLAAEAEEDPFGATEPTAASGQEPASEKSSAVVQEASVEDLLSETTSEMEAGDKEYKDMIAETQLDNIFN